MTIMSFLPCQFQYYASLSQKRYQLLQDCIFKTLSWLMFPLKTLLWPKLARPMTDVPGAQETLYQIVCDRHGKMALIKNISLGPFYLTSQSELPCPLIPGQRWWPKMMKCDVSHEPSFAWTLDRKHKVSHLKCIWQWLMKLMMVLVMVTKAMVLMTLMTLRYW